MLKLGDFFVVNFIVKFCLATDVCEEYYLDTL